MTERERLIELLNFVKCKAESCSAVDGGRCGDLDKLDRCQIEANADYLLANGVIAPPCKVGDTVYFPMETDLECEPYVDVGTVFSIGIDERHTMWISVRYKSGLRYYHTSDDFGKTVFISREEAEKALEERSKG